MLTHRPLVSIFVFFSCGIFINRLIVIPFSIISLFALIFLIVLFAVFNRTKYSAVILFLLFFCLGSVYSQAFEVLRKGHLYHVSKYYYKDPINIKGVVDSDIQKRDFFNNIKTTFIIDVKEIKTKWGWRKKSGRVLVHVFRDLNIDYGDFVNLVGKLHKPYNFSKDDNFSYKEYLKQRKVYLILSVKKNAEVNIISKNNGSMFKAVSINLRNKLKNILYKNLTKNECGIMQAILIGDRSKIPKHIKELFVRTGTAHILSISGLHVGIVAVLFLTFFKIVPMGRNFQFVFTIILLFIYMLLTGCRPSVLRATIMTIVFLSGFIIERESDGINTICFAAIIILLFNPLNLFDIGFQLSFVCVLSILLLKNKIKSVIEIIFLHSNNYEKFYKRTINLISNSLSISLSVWFGVLGLIIYYFNIITPITILANLIIVPIIAIIITLGFGLLIVGGFWSFGALTFSLCIKVVLNLMVGITFILDKIPFAHIYIRDVNNWIILIYYIILLVLFYFPYQKLLGNNFRFIPTIKNKL